jgi:flagellar basal body P-ring protein FlgI
VSVKLNAENWNFIVAGVAKAQTFTNVRAEGDVIYGTHVETGVDFSITKSNMRVNVDTPNNSIATRVANAVNVAYSTRVVRTLAQRHGAKLTVKSPTSFEAVWS